MAGSVLDKLNKVPTAIKVIVLVVAVIGVVAGFHFTRWAPLDEEAEALTAKRGQLERRYKEQKAVADNLSTFQENTRKLEEDLQTALEQLPRDPEIPNLLRDIFMLGRKSGVDFKTFEPQGIRQQRLYAELPIRLQISGGYHEIAVFFDRIGKLSRIVNVSNLDVSSSTNDEDETMVNVNCVATTFMFTGGGS